MKSNERLTYTRPELRHYGAITTLVQGNVGSQADGASMTTMA